MRLQPPAWLSFGWPSQCLLCHRWPARPLCSDCQMRFRLRQRRCLTCALALPTGINDTLCGACLRQPPPLLQCLVAVDYSYPWAPLIQQWKFHDQPSLCRHMRHWFAPNALQLALLATQITIPIPLSAERLRARGYNQSLLLARAICAPHIHPTLLQRLRDTAPQAGQRRTERLHNLRHAFGVPEAARSQLAGKQVLLVDDVITTGATVHAAAQALLQAGAAGVRALAIARTP